MIHYVTNIVGRGRLKSLNTLYQSLLCNYIAFVWVS